MTNANSFANVKKWLQEIDRYAGPNVVKLLVGNKADLTDERRISTEEGREFAESMGLHFLESSAKSDLNVESTFTGVADTVLQKRLALNTDSVPVCT